MTTSAKQPDAYRGEEALLWVRVTVVSERIERREPGAKHKATFGPLVAVANDADDRRKAPRFSGESG